MGVKFLEVTVFKKDVSSTVDRCDSRPTRHSWDVIIWLSSWILMTSLGTMKYHRAENGQVPITAVTMREI